jgi:ubiquinone/menaquinone biosynthesis C-methylase UbiE
LTEPLPFTGERFTPEITGAIGYEHWHRYGLLRDAVKGKNVLDAACGEGYGSFLLAGSAATVVGADIDAAAVAHASQRYASRANLRYTCASVTALPMADASVDLIVSFETIEHLEPQAAMLDEFRRVLTPEGALVISSPNKPVYSGEAGARNEYHVRELTRDELEAALATHFPCRAWYGQRVLAHSAVWSEPAAQATAQWLAQSGDTVGARTEPAAPMYYIVVCGAREATLPALPKLSLFDDAEQSLYRDYQRALLAEKRLYWDHQDALKVADARQAELVTAVNDLASARQRADALSAALAHARAEVDERDRLRLELEAARAQLAYRETWPGWVRWPLGRARRGLRGRTS